MILKRNCERALHNCREMGGRVYCIVASEEAFEFVKTRGVNVCRATILWAPTYLYTIPLIISNHFLVSASPMMLKYNSLPLTWKLDESLLAIIIIINLYHSRWVNFPSFWPSSRRSSRPASCRASAGGQFNNKILIWVLAWKMAWDSILILIVFGMSRQNSSDFSS